MILRNVWTYQMSENFWYLKYDKLKNLKKYIIIFVGENSFSTLSFELSWEYTNLNWTK